MLTIVLVVWLFEPAPPKTIVISAGPPDGSFLPAAEEYKKILARNGITLKVLPSDGSLQNLHRLLDPHQHVDLALVQGGVAQGLDTSSLMSLGSVFYAPIVVLYRGPEVTRLAQLRDKRIAIGREGGGTRVIALNLLKANGIEPGDGTTLLPFDGQEAARQVAIGKLDAAFFNGDSATRGLMLRLLQIPGVKAMSFEQAAAYTRLFPYLNQIDLPPGVLDLGRNQPPATVHLISPMVELVARPNLHPAISDLLIEAAQEVHGPGSLLQHSGEFPSPIEHEYRISEDAARYYHSGKNLLYRNLPFWAASLLDRTLVLLIPLAVLVFPTLRLLPAIYRWRVRSRIYRWYGLLIAIEREALGSVAPEKREELIKELDHIEENINRIKMPLAYADGFYVLREHVGFVRARLTGEHSQHF
ncbi:TAXI family TRAP transporter solute-binding subunit [Silvimonas iriomotensis]|uniref:C4-dicarboxylate ABC transporter substrate-binding protein n=1 Tax=Silvimonas iriomotensis TaxID=449662 RepID=A0ABQ2P9M9_9NEIS|nr:TAXI family TRAP transporter solute-binding subunit [Silvimonas iriomotensis]GGP21627.1 C4-dicarboxylate ABC transporter substrate-binding protein [Silvimonas iriomotensis]